MSIRFRGMCYWRSTGLREVIRQVSNSKSERIPQEGMDFQKPGVHSRPATPVPPSIFSREAPRRGVARSLRAMMGILRIVVGFCRYYSLLLAESHLARRLFGASVWRTAGLPLPAG